MSDDQARADYVRTAIDGWNTWVNYWDRRTKYGKMMATAYAFYRGTAQLFWHDFAGDERLTRFGSEKTTTWLQGDAHAYNFGAFRNDVEVLVYSLNDFDESIVADYQLDLWRLAVSVVLIARENDNLSKSKLEYAIEELASSYLTAMQSFVGDKAAEKTPCTADNAYGKLDDFLDLVEKDDSSKHMLDKWAPVGKDGVRAFDLSNEKLGSVTTQERQGVLDAMDGYWASTAPEEAAAAMDPARSKVLDVACRLLAGTGSLGTKRYYLLLEDGEGAQHILDVKQQSKPAGYEFLDAAGQADYDGHAQGNDARAHAVAYRALSVHPDPYLGWMRLGDGWFSVRERSPYKEAFPALKEEATGDFSTLELDSETRYTKLAQQWAAVLAADHAYAERVEAAERGEEESLAAQIVAATKGHEDDFVDLVRSIAFAYADQVEADWKAFVDGLGADIEPVT